MRKADDELTAPLRCGEWYDDEIDAFYASVHQRRWTVSDEEWRLRMLLKKIVGALREVVLDPEVPNPQSRFVCKVCRTQLRPMKKYCGRRCETIAKLMYDEQEREVQLVASERHGK